MNSSEFGEYLREKRERANLTMGQLAKLANISRPYISQLESGKRGIPSPEILKKLVGPLGLSYAELMLQAGHVDRNAAIAMMQQRPLTFADSAIIDAILEITKAEKERCEHIAPIVSHIEFFEDQLEAFQSNPSISVKDLKDLLWRLEGDGDSYEPMIGSRMQAREIETLLDVLNEVVSREAGSNIEHETTKESLRYLEQTDIAYNGHPLTAQDRKRILTMLEVLFPEYQQPPANEHEVD